jgi:biopolymer transport protein ExbD
MGRFKKSTSSKEVPAVSTASLPDIIFMLLFFFMSVTSMKEVSFKVKFTMPEATELQALEKKNLVRFVYVGVPSDSKMGTLSRIQLDDDIVDDPTQIMTYVVNERSAMAEELQDQLVIALKADKYTKMGIINEVEQALRNAYALKITYTALQKTNNSAYLR